MLVEQEHTDVCVCVGHVRGVCFCCAVLNVSLIQPVARARLLDTPAQVDKPDVEHVLVVSLGSECADLCLACAL